MKRERQLTKRERRAIVGTDIGRKLIDAAARAPRWEDVPEHFRQRIVLLLRSATTTISAIAPPAVFEAAARHLEELPMGQSAGPQAVDAEPRTGVSPSDEQGPHTQGDGVDRPTPPPLSDGG